jgi:hypothetical protein
MVLVNWMELAPGWAVVPDFDSQAETADGYRVPPSLPPGSTSTTANSATKE